MTADTLLTRAAGFTEPLTGEVMREWLAGPVEHQPSWGDPWRTEKVRAELAARPALVDTDEVRRLRLALADVAAGRLQVVQAGDCAEDFAECVAEALTRKVGLLDALAGVMRLRTGVPVLRVGRIAGQFAKPRSRPTELVDGRELPSYYGPLVNDPAPEPAARVPDPRRMLQGYEAAARAMVFLRAGRAPGAVTAPVWTSHEALVLDYELPQVRRDESGRLLMTSTHWPWVGERTRDVDGAHVRLLASVVNPVACKVGPRMTRTELLRLCAVLDPDRAPGRLTLIARLGADVVADTLPDLVGAVRLAGHPVVWMCDPVHGNTVVGPTGHKTRVVDTVAAEVEAFCAAVRANGGVAGGLHLETTPDDVTESASTFADLHGVGERYTSLCDPRLNPAQAMDVAGTWNP